MRTLFLFFLGLFLAACQERSALREWQPTDHQPPAAVTPEGQGAEAEPSASPEEDDARASAALWGMRCASCHGLAGRGDGPERPPGAALPDMTQPAYRSARSDAELATVIKNGRGLMPAFGDQLSEEGVAALVRHVRRFAPTQ